MDKENRYFTKNIISIPIQLNLYWCLLCVVFNPGKIKTNVLNSQPNTEITYVLLFNSYGSHDKVVK